MRIFSETVFLSKTRHSVAGTFRAGSAPVYFVKNCSLLQNFLTLITVSYTAHSEWAGVCSSAIISWQEEQNWERECGDYCSLTDVIPNTAPKCCVPPQILNEGLFKKQPHTTGLLCALFLIYSQHKFKVAQHDLKRTRADNLAVFILTINTAKHNSCKRKDEVG